MVIRCRKYEGKKYRLHRSRKMSGGGGGGRERELRAVGGKRPRFSRTGDWEKKPSVR